MIPGTEYANCLIEAKATHTIPYSTLNVIFHELTVPSPLAGPGFPSTRFPDLQESTYV